MSFNIKLFMCQCNHAARGVRLQWPYPNFPFPNVPSALFPRNLENVAAVLAEVLGFKSAEISMTQRLSTHGRMASRPAKVSRPRSEVNNVHALWRLLVTNIAAFAYAVTTLRTACCPRIHSSEQSHNHSWFKQSCAPVSHIHQHCQYVCFVYMPTCVLT